MSGFNVNDNVWVRLLPRGLEALKANHDRLNASSGGLLGDFTAPKVDNGGWTKFQLWELMHELGAACFMGLQPPFETTIRLSEPPAPGEVEP